MSDRVRVTYGGRELFADLMVSGNGAGMTAGAPTYSAAGTGYTAYATPTDLLTISGSATKTIEVTNFVIWIQSTSAALQTIDFLKRSTANTGGTSTNPTLIPYDSGQAAATAVLNLYTAAPVLGTSLGAVKTILAVSSTLTTGPNAIGLNGFINTLPYPTLVNDVRRGIVLRGAGESLCINYRGAALTGGFSATWFAEWTER